MSDDNAIQIVRHTGISVAVAATAGEEESGTLALTLAYPIKRSRLLLTKAAAAAIAVVLVVLGTFVGMVAGVAVAGGGLGFGHIAAVSLHLAFFGWAVGAFALALAAATGRRALASGGAAAFAVVGFLLNGFAPLSGAVEWLKYLSVFYYYEGHDPIGSGVHLSDLAILALVTIVFTGAAAVGAQRRDLRK